jgi:hypothetical protein
MASSSQHYRHVQGLTTPGTMKGDGSPAALTCIRQARSRATRAKGGGQLSTRLHLYCEHAKAIAVEGMVCALAIRFPLGSMIENVGSRWIGSVLPDLEPQP